MVGSDINPGTYRAQVGANCLWKRVDAFSGEPSSSLEFGFTTAAGQEEVSIAASDEGFVANDNCGDWTRIGP